MLLIDTQVESLLSTVENAMEMFRVEFSSPKVLLDLLTSDEIKDTLRDIISDIVSEELDEQLEK